MRGISSIIAAAVVCAYPTGAHADSSESFGSGAPTVRSGSELPPYLQCVPYARRVSGIQIYGDAHTWWDQAAGRYERGDTPRVGAVMAFEPYRNMTLGHVAAVSKIIDSRTVLLDHANWSPINGRRGQIEHDVMAIDVSPDNDWSEVRVWYDPIQGLGTTAWPVHGFIYSKSAPLAETRLASSRPTASQPRIVQTPVSAEPSRAFMSAFAGMEPAAAPVLASAPARLAVRPPAKKELPRRVAAQATRDPIAAALARYGN